MSDVDVLWTECTCDGEEGEASWQPPNQPGCWQEGLAEPLTVVRAVVRGTVAEDEGIAVPTVVVVGSLQPNQPGVLQVVVVEMDVLVLVLELVLIVFVDVLDSSRHPHHPGVLQVVVRVLVEKVELLVDVLGSEPLLSKYFQLKQS